MTRSFAAALVLAILLSACSSRTKTAPPSATPPGTLTQAVTASADQATPAPTLTARAAASPTVSPTSIPLPSTAQISAPSHDVVWVLVAGTVLFRSTDHGETWTQRTVPSVSDNFELSFADDRHGWLFRPGAPATQCQAQGIAMWRTTDGGATWEKLPPVVNVVESLPGISESQCKENLSFVDPTHGFLSAWDPNSRPSIYWTADGGNSWTASAPLPDPPDQQTSPGGFSLRPQGVERRGDVLAAGATGWQHMYVYRSTDGGATWTYAAMIPNARDVGSIAFLDATHWWVSAEDVTAPFTADAGATWQSASGILQFAAPFAPAIVFADTQVGYATVRGLIKRTLDGGAHWVDIQTPGTEKRQ